MHQSHNHEKERTEYELGGRVWNVQSLALCILTLKYNDIDLQQCSYFMKTDVHCQQHVLIAFLQCILDSLLPDAISDAS